MRAMHIHTVHTQPSTSPVCHTGTHDLNHTGVWRVGAGWGGSYVNALTAPPCSPLPPSPASSRSASARGGLAGAREQLGLAEAPGAEKPDPDPAPGRARDRGPEHPPHTAGSPSSPAPQGRLTLSILRQLPAPSQGSTWGPLTVSPLWTSPWNLTHGCALPLCALIGPTSGTRKGQRILKMEKRGRLKP